jgi:uncharacterized protein involved in exopolysaccharide biosynthesis
MPDNLFSIARQIYARRFFIILVTLVATIAGLCFWLLKPKKYEAKTIFILKNPLYADRNFLYNSDTKFIDYFASEDDIDKFMLMANSDDLQMGIIMAARLDEVYKVDTAVARQAQALKRKFSSNLKIVRTDKKSLTLSFTDTDPSRAAKVANISVDVLEHSLRGFYNDIRANMYGSIITKVKQEDSAIAALTDTLVVLREKHGIYDIISPSRYSITLNSPKASGKPNYARGLEEIQNYESLKDQLVTDRSKHVGLINQYTTGTGVNELPLTKIIAAAKPPVKPAGIGLAMTLLVCGFTGAFFAMLYVLFITFYRKAISE